MRLVVGVLASVLAVACLSSRASGSGVNLSWDDCGTHGASFKTFACNTNSGQHTLVGSFLSNFVVPPMNSSTALLDITLNGSPVSDWWLLQPGSCRAGALTANFDFTSGPSSCLDYWQGGAIGAASIDPPAGNRVRVRVQSAFLSDPGTPIPADTEVYSFKVNISHAKSTGEGACSGCDMGACILFNSLQLFQPEAGYFIFAGPVDRAFVDWQCPSGITIHGPCFFFGCPTPARSQTWGQIKQLYR